MINTRFWEDSYIANLDPIEKLLFLYLITNTHTTLCGIYELPIKIMSAETGIEKEMILKIIGRFTKDKKVLYKNGWMAVKNFIKHHINGSPQLKKGIEEDIKNCPKWGVDFIWYDTISIPYPYHIDTISPSASASALASNTQQSETDAGVKKKDMKTYNENKHNSDEDFLPLLDIETGEIQDPRLKTVKTPNNKIMFSLIVWAETRRRQKFAKWKWQMKALSSLCEISISPQRIKERWVELEEDKFYQDKLDFWSVVSSFDKKPKN